MILVDELSGILIMPTLRYPDPGSLIPCRENMMGDIRNNLKELAIDGDMPDREYILVGKGYRCTQEMSTMFRRKADKYDR